MEEDPGLKPHYGAGIVVGLKPYANPRDNGKNLTTART